MLRADAVFEVTLGASLLVGAAANGLVFPAPVGRTVALVVGGILLLLGGILWRTVVGLRLLAGGNLATAVAAVVWLAAASGFSAAAAALLGAAVAGLVALAATQLALARSATCNTPNRVSCRTGSPQRQT